MINRRFIVVPIIAVLVSISLLVSSMGTNNTFSASDGGMQGLTSSPSAELAPIALTLYKTYTGHYGYVTAGIGVRNTGRGTISLVLPRGTSLTAAYLYWIILDNTTPNSNNNKIVINGILVTGTLIGSGPSPCWTPPKGYTYRAWVYDQLSQAEGRYGTSYGLEVGGMRSNMTDGQSPWKTAGGAPMAESVHLVLVYSDSAIPSSVIKIYNGYFESSGGTATFAYAWPARASGTALFSHLTADGQATSVTPFAKSIDFTGPTAITTTIDKANTLNGRDPSITSKATYEGSLADTNTYNVGSLVPLAGGASAITYNLDGDCISWAAMIFATGQ